MAARTKSSEFMFVRPLRLSVGPENSTFEVIGSMTVEVIDILTSRYFDTREDHERLKEKGKMRVDLLDEVGPKQNLLPVPCVTGRCGLSALSASPKSLFTPNALN